MNNDIEIAIGIDVFKVFKESVNSSCDAVILQQVLMVDSTVKKEYELTYSIVILPDFVELPFPNVELPEKVSVSQFFHRYLT